MKNKLLFTFAMIVSCGGFLLAQPQLAGKPKMVAQLNEPLMSPVWSPDGNKLAVTSVENSGIWIMDKNGRNLQQLTSDRGAGYKMQWSADNSFILARTSVLDNHFVYNEVKLYNVTTKAEEVLLTKTRDLKGVPYWTENGAKVAFKLNEEQKISKKVAKNIINSSLETKAYILSRQMMEDPMGISARIEGLTQFASDVVYNPVASPKGDKVVFQVAGKGLFVYDVNTAQVKSLGTGERASWMADGRYVIVAQIEDDGHEILKGELQYVNVETAEKGVLLSSDNYVVVNSSVSVDGKKLAFEDYASGAIYVVELK